MRTASLTVLLLGLLNIAQAGDKREIPLPGGGPIEGEQADKAAFERAQKHFADKRFAKARDGAARPGRHRP